MGGYADFLARTAAGRFSPQAAPIDVGDVHPVLHLGRSGSSRGRSRTGRACLLGRHGYREDVLCNWSTRARPATRALVVAPLAVLPSTVPEPQSSAIAARYCPSEGDGRRPRHQGTNDEMTPQRTSRPTIRGMPSRSAWMRGVDDPIHPTQVGREDPGTPRRSSIDDGSVTAPTYVCHRAAGPRNDDELTC